MRAASSGTSRKGTDDMQFTTLGQSGLIVSRIGFGAMTFTQGDQSLAAVYKTGAEEAATMVRRAMDAGVSFFDTADGYAGGESERMLGAALGDRRSDVVVATKVGFRTGSAVHRSGLSRKHILDSVDASLRRLSTDWIDLYIVHREDPFTPLEETLSTLDAIVRQGKVRYLGFSNWSAWRAAAAISMQRANGWAPFINGQMHYSLVTRDVERDVVPMFAHMGVGLSVWSPLAGGFLSGKYTRDTAPAADDRLSGFDIIPFDRERGWRTLEVLRSLAEARGVTVAQLALAWLLDRPSVASVIVGASKTSQLDNNLGALSVTLSAEERTKLDAVSALDPSYPHWFIDRLQDAQTRGALAR